MIPFCPDLQLRWILDRIEFRNSDNLRIKLRATSNQEVPDTKGRHVSDILSYPEIHSTILQAEFVFTACISVQTRDEFAASLCEKEEKGEGKTFIRFLASETLSAYRNSLPAETHRSLYHYRIVCPEVIIDVICGKPPVITKTPHRKPDSPIAG